MPALRCLISALTQAGGGDLLLRFASSVQSCCGAGGALQAEVAVCGERSPCSGHTGSAPLRGVPPEQVLPPPTLLRLPAALCGAGPALSAGPVFGSSTTATTTCALHVYLCAQLLSCVQLFVTPWTVAHQGPLSVGFSRGSSEPRDQTQVSYITFIGRQGSLPLASPGSPYIYIYMCVCVCVCVCVYVYVCICVYIYVYIYIHIHVYIHTHTYIHTQICPHVHI